MKATDEYDFNGQTPTLLRGPHPTERSLYERLLDAVIEKRLRPGEHLNEAKLASAYRVPRSRVRRVLNRLRAEGLVEFKLHRGAFICRPTVEEAQDVYEARLNVEQMVVRLSCERADKAMIGRLRAQIKEEQTAFNEARAGVNRIAGDFHILLAEATRNHVLVDILRPLVRRFCVIQSLYERRAGVLCLVEEHARLVDLVEAGDVQRAEAVMQSHFEHIFHSLDLSPERSIEADIYVPVSE